MENKKSILIVEDDEFLARLITARLGQKGFQVDRVVDGMDAIVFLEKNHKPDLIVLDVIMPRMSGFQFLEAVGDELSRSGTSVMVLSNLSQEGDMDKIKKFAIERYLMKAYISLDKVIFAIEDLLGQPSLEALAERNSS